MNEPEKFQPWATIWLDPRGTIRQIIETDPKKSMLLLIVLGGLGITLRNSAIMGLADMMPFGQVIVFCLMAAPLSGVINVYLGGWLLHMTTRFFGGFATKQELRIAVAWSLAPIVYLLPLWGVKYILFREELFKTEKPFIQDSQFLSGLFGFFDIVDFFVTLFTLFILFNVIAEVNGFSLWKSIGSIGILLIIATIPTMLLLRFFTAM